MIQFSIWAPLFLAVGLVSLFNIERNKKMMKSFSIFILVLMSMNLHLSDVHGLIQTKVIIIVFLALHFILAQFEIIKSYKWGLLLAFLTVFVFLFSTENLIIRYGYDIKFRSWTSIGLIGGGILLLPILEFKLKAIKKWINSSLNDLDEQIILLFIAGILIFLAMFLAGSFGVFLLTIGLIVGAYYSSPKYFSIVLALMIISFLSFFLEKTKLNSVDLTLGKTLLGLFLGFSSLMFFSSFQVLNKKNIVGFVLSQVGLILMISALCLLGNVKSDFGGVEAFIGFLVGCALAFLFVKSFYLDVWIATLVLSLGFLFFKPIEKSELSATKTLNNEQSKEIGLLPNVNFETLESIDIDSLEGVLQIVPKVSKLYFELGPKGGRTKGVILNPSGRMTIQNKRIDLFVELLTENLSTFNKYRDEAIMEEDYLNVRAYPRMNYTSSHLTKSDKGYILMGSFTLLGVTKPLEVEIKFLKSELNDLKMIGKSKLDRPIYGMIPDSKEGNIVDFEFDVELKK